MRGYVAGLAAEFGQLGSTVVRRWRVRGFAGFALTMGIAAAILVAWALDHTSARTVVTACCGVRVDDPIGVAMLRLPGSLIAPASMLPVWGSVVQAVIAFGLAEAAVGLRTTVLVAASAHLIATLAGRCFVWYAPAAVGGLPPSWRTALDTGPSAATVGLAVYLALLLGCRRTGLIVLAMVAVIFATTPDLAGREHLVAMVVGAVCAAIHLRSFRRAATALQEHATAGADPLRVTSS
jgi:hypothetical protein